MKKVIQDAEKATAKLAAEVKEEAPKVAEKAAKAAEKTVKAAGKTVKEAARKAETAKTEAKKAVATAAAKAPAKRGMKETVYLQFLGKEINKDDVMKKVKEVWTKQMKHKVGDMHTVALYLKPEENMAYFVINGDVTGSVTLD